MEKAFKFLIVFLVAIIVMQPMITLAGSSARVIPTGKVVLINDGKEAGEFNSEMPLPQGKLMSCQGNCLVQADGLQLVAHDKAVLALAGSGKEWDLKVNEGNVEFAIGFQSRQLSLQTPTDAIRVEAAADAANGPVRGLISVTKDSTNVTAQEGSLLVAYRDESKVLRAGETMLVANNAPGAGVAAVSVLGDSTGGSSAVAWGAVGAVAVVGGVTAGLIASGDDDDHHDVSENAAVGVK
ncbi:MAG: hypothetical protein AB2L11_07010 [Syntrophobacteraceae bacterium]